MQLSSDELCVLATHMEVPIRCGGADYVNGGTGLLGPTPPFCAPCVTNCRKGIELRQWTPEEEALLFNCYYSRSLPYDSLIRILKDCEIDFDGQAFKELVRDAYRDVVEAIPPDTVDALRLAVLNLPKTP